MLLSAVIILNMLPGSEAEQAETERKEKISQKLDEVIVEIMETAKKNADEQYEHAKELLYTRQFGEAKKAFKELGNYRDSPTDTIRDHL